MTRSTSKWMAVSTRRPPSFRSKMAQTSLSLEPQFFAQTIMPKRFASCAANDKSVALSSLVYFSGFARHHRLGFFGRFSHHFVGLRDAHNFFDGCFALRDASPAVLPQSFHAFDNGTLLKLAAIALSHNQLSQRLSDVANFIDRRATLIAGLAALITAGTALEVRAEFFHGKTDLGKVVARIIHHLDTVGTNRAHKPLSDERLDDRGEQKRFHVHIEQTRDAAYGIIRVQRAENKVASHGCANRDVRSFNVADLADHHYIGVLSQDVTETFGER